MALHFSCIWRSQWHDKGVREPGDVEGAITSSACGSSGCWRPAHRSREPRENSRSTITPCGGTGGTELPDPTVLDAPQRMATDEFDNERVVARLFGHQA